MNDFRSPKRVVVDPWHLFRLFRFAPLACATRPALLAWHLFACSAYEPRSTLPSILSGERFSKRSWCRRCSSNA